MKYRRLTLEELSHFEKEFINFLAINGISPEVWEEIKNENSDRINNLLDQFSDLVFEKVLQNIRFLEHRTPKDLKVFKCMPDRIKLIGIIVDRQSQLDLTQQAWQQQILETLQQGNGNEVRIYAAEKSYKTTREEELFNMVSSGCFVVDESLFQSLESLHSS
mgnify:CR=1 FL=1